MSTTPGILWENSGVTSSPENLTDEKFNEWYNDVHIPDVLKIVGIHSAYRYKSIQSASNSAYLALYPISNISLLESPELRSILTISDYFPGSSYSCYDYAKFESRFYEHIDGYEKPGAKSGPANLVISAALTPASGTDAEFDAWYKNEHYRTLAECRGYVRTRRYKLTKTTNVDYNPPMYLALHEFQGEELPADDLDKSGATTWAIKIMSAVIGKEVGVYKLLGSWGDIKAKF